MKVAEFGSFSEPLVAFGGIYSNAHALEALRREVGGGPALFTGDAVGYCGEPARAVAMLRETGWPAIAGNVEKNLAAGAPDCGCGFVEGSVCERLSRAWYDHAAAASDAAARSWMAGLPEIGIATVGGRRMAVLHGGATDAARYLWPSDPDDAFEREIAAIEAVAGPVDGVIAGHAGIAFHRQLSGRDWINAGAIGLPPHDGRPETRFAVIDGGGVVFARLDYDHAAAAQAMQDVGLPDDYRLALSGGIWPSEDVLPAELRR